MSLLELRVKIDYQYERWIAVSKDALADGKIDCGEAQKWLAWYRQRKKELNLLKREINLEVRGIRTGFRVKIAEAETRGAKTRFRDEQTIEIAPYTELLGKLERLLIEGDRLKPTLETFIAKECEG
jgi:hypothetical protein